MAEVIDKKAAEKKILEITKENRLGVLSTVVGNKPWARYVTFYRLDDSLNLYCSTHMMSRKVAQLDVNPFVHITLGAGCDNQIGPYIQFSGKGKMVFDEKVREKVWAKQKATLSKMFEGPDDPTLGVLRFTPVEIEVWGTGAEPLTPIMWTAHGE